MLNPDFPFSYDHYLAHPDGLVGPAGLHGTEVAVVGAGLSGLVTAYELMKLGLRPVVYEAARIGGRPRPPSFPAAPGAVADLGGMRFPVWERPSSTTWTCSAWKPVTSRNRWPRPRRVP